MRRVPCAYRLQQPATSFQHPASSIEKLPRLKLIPDTGHRMNIFRLFDFRLDFFSEPLDMHVDSAAGLVQQGITPYLLLNEFSRL